MAYYSPILIITDGTAENTVDLLNPSAGYILCDWSPVRPGLQYDYVTDTVSGLRRPTGVRFDTPIDTFTVTCRDTTAGKAIAHERKLSRILRNAVRFWTNTNQIEQPYYIVARAKNEAVKRYALILSTSLHNSGNPYAQPFATNAKNKTTTDLQFNIEHDLWSPDPPFVTRNGKVTSSADSPYWFETNVGYHESNTYSGENIGDVAGWTSGGIVGFAAAANHGAFTSFDKVVRGSGGLDVLNTGYSAIDLFNSTTDYTYFGVDSTKKHIFNNIVLIPAKSTSSSHGTLSVQYYGESGWTNINSRDTSHGMKKPGILSWLNPHNMQPATLYGMLGWWVRVKRTGGDSTGTRAQVLPYTVAWNHIEIPETAKGDAGVRLDIRFTQQAWDNDDRISNFTYETEETPDKVVIGGTRKELISCISPNYNTYPYSTPAVFVKPTDTDMMTGFSVMKSSPYGVAHFAHVNPNKFTIIGDYESVAAVQFRQNQSSMYSGNFRAFWRFRLSPYGGSDILYRPSNVTLTFRGRVGYRQGEEGGSGIDSTDTVSWFQTGQAQLIKSPASRFYVYDMGTVSLGDPTYVGQGSIDMYQTMDLQVKYSQADGSGIRFNVVDLVLIPVDEFFMEMDIPKTVNSNFAPVPSQDVIINTASALGKLNGHVASHDGSYFDRVQGKRGNVSFPVGRPLWIDGDGSTYLHFFSWNTQRMESSPSDTFPIDIATAPVYLSAIGDEL